MERSVYIYKNDILTLHQGNALSDADLVFVFGSVGILETPNFYSVLKDSFPNAHICGASCGSSILSESLVSDQCTILAIQFKAAQVRNLKVKISDRHDVDGVIHEIHKHFPLNNLKGLCILVDGFAINSGGLISNLTKKFPSVPIFGGLASDGDAMITSCVMNNGIGEKGIISVSGFYGESLSISTALAGGWQRFGPERLITKSHDNILEEIDGKKAVQLYKEHLQKEHLNLPHDGLMLPLSVYPKDHPELGKTRSVIGITDDEKALVFAGDVPKGHQARFMTSSIQSLCRGAEEAVATLKPNGDGFAIAFSCIGHHMFLSSMTEDELDVLTGCLGPNIPLVGFYSNGEICPIGGKHESALHNQTTAIALITEA